MTQELVQTTSHPTETSRIVCTHRMHTKRHRHFGCDKLRRKHVKQSKSKRSL